MAKTNDYYAMCLCDIERIAKKLRYSSDDREQLRVLVVDTEFYETYREEVSSDGFDPDWLENYMIDKIKNFPFKQTD